MNITSNSIYTLTTTGIFSVSRSLKILGHITFMRSLHKVYEMNA